MFPDELRVSPFPDTFPLYLDSGIVSPLRLGWVNGVCVFRCNLPPALLVECPGSFTCHCGNTGVKLTSNKRQHTKLTLEKNILPPFLPRFELATFRSRVRRCNQLAIPALRCLSYCTTYWLYRNNGTSLAFTIIYLEVSH